MTVLRSGTVTAAVKLLLQLSGQNCRRALMVSYSSENKTCLISESYQFNTRQEVIKMLKTRDCKPKI